MQLVGAAYSAALAEGYLWHEFGDSAFLCAAENPERSEPVDELRRDPRLGPERDTTRGGEPDARTVHSGRSFEFTIARLT